MKILKAGDTLDIFRLRRELHQGALANLFLAEDLLSKEEVVLKIPVGDILNHPIALYHYQNEERISRLIDHPGIVRFIHRQRSRQYIIMERLMGKDLRSRIGKKRCLVLDEALVLMAKLFEVLSYLHGKSVVHLDLKPENIICLKNGDIKLIDFGLANSLHNPDLLALDMNSPQGTPWYIAPEQLFGERNDLRSDIYSLGMVFYEMLTGFLPWPRSSKLGVARRRLRYNPTPPRHHNPSIPPQIQDVILSAIARHREKRYQRMEDMENDLANWQQLPVTAGGKNMKSPPIWQYLFPVKSVQRTKIKSGDKKIWGKPQIIGGLIDSEGGDYMLAEIKKRMLLCNAEVALVHVIEEEADSHFRRYGIAVEGEKLMAGLEQAVQTLRRFNIDPTIRLIRGEVVETLAGICREMNAKLLVLGTPRKKGGRLRKASVPYRLQKDSPCKVIVTTFDDFVPDTDLAFLDPWRLTGDQVLSVDIFLVDLWFDHLHYHTEFIYNLILHPERSIDLNQGKCRLGRFLTSLDDSEAWQEITAQLSSRHEDFHRIADRMAKLGGGDHAGLQRLYLNESLPISRGLKNTLGNISKVLRSQLEKPPSQPAFFADETCPMLVPDLPCYGPLMRALNLGQDLYSLVEEKVMPPIEEVK